MNGQEWSQIFYSTFCIKNGTSWGGSVINDVTNFYDYGHPALVFRVVRIGKKKKGTLKIYTWINWRGSKVVEQKIITNGLIFGWKKKFVP